MPMSKAMIRFTFVLFMCLFVIHSVFFLMERQNYRVSRHRELDKSTNTMVIGNNPEFQVQNARKNGLSETAAESPLRRYHNSLEHENIRSHPFLISFQRMLYPVLFFIAGGRNAKMFFKDLGEMRVIIKPNQQRNL